MALSFISIFGSVGEYPIVQTFVTLVKCETHMKKLNFMKRENVMEVSAFLNFTIVVTKITTITSCNEQFYGNQSITLQDLE